MLRSFGFDAAVLEGGFEKWRAKGRPTESGKPKGYLPATFVAAPRPGVFVGGIIQCDVVVAELVQQKRWVSGRATSQCRLKSAER